MTPQIGSRFTSDHPVFDPGDWFLQSLIRGEPTVQNFGWGSNVRVARFKPRRSIGVATSNAKGYYEWYHLASDGRVSLVEVRYDDDGSITPVNELLEGDFFLVLKSNVRGPRLYVSMRDGVLVNDAHVWKHERYTGPRHIDVEIVAGPHPDYPHEARLRSELFPP